MTTTPAESPDVTPVIDLTLHDGTPQTLVEQAILDAASKLPGWVAREGNTEVVLLETQALMGSETIYAVNRLPKALLAELLGRYGLTVDPGVAATVSVVFTTAAAGDVLIPAGTRLRLLYAGGSAFVDFLTDTDLLIVGGAFTGTVAATCETLTGAVNGTPAGGTVELVDAISAVDAVTLASTVTGGQDPETQEAYLARGAQLFRRLVSTLVLPVHFTAAALEEPAVVRATTLDLYNPTLGTGAPGAHPGHVTVAVAGAAGASLSVGVRTALEAALEAKAMASLVVHAVDPTITAVPVTVQVTALPGFEPATVIASVQAALTGYLSPDTWPWQGTVYRNELIALVDGVEGVGRVVTLTAPAADTVLAGVAPLATAGTLTVTVA